MKKITRLCSLLLALALMAGLTACGETTDSTASAPAPEESGNTPGNSRTGSRGQHPGGTCFRGGGTGKHLHRGNLCR